MHVLATLHGFDCMRGILSRNSDEPRYERSNFGILHSDFVRHSDFGVRVLPGYLTVASRAVHQLVSSAISGDLAFVVDLHANVVVLQQLRPQFGLRRT